MDGSTGFRYCASCFYMLYFPFFSFRLRALAKWPIWLCGGRQHRISVLHITLLHALLSFPFLSFTSTREVADMAVWWTAAPDIGPVHHASTCSTFLSFHLRVFAKWPIWPCGGRQHRISVLRIMLQHALFSFLFLSVTSVGEVADLALWWTAAPDFRPAHIMLQLDHMVKWRIFR